MAAPDKWDIYKDKRGEYRWRRRNGVNNKIVAASTEGYKARSDCKDNAERHGMDGNPRKFGKGDSWEFYKDKTGDHRWRRRATNKEIVGASSEGYRSKQSAQENAKLCGFKG